MGISIYPPSGGGVVNNDFVVDMADTTNNVIDLPRAYAAGAYAVTLSSGDTSFDIYFLDSDGSAVAYGNEASIVASAEFESVCVLGVGTAEVLSFAFSGVSSDANSEGDALGAGAYLTSISPSDLPTLDDTANVIGGNFATDVEIYFESGTVSLAAKQVARADSTALIITRPDVFDPALDPWDIKAINPGVTPPTGSNAHILAGTVDAGASPVWVTTSPLPDGQIQTAYSATLEATDADGAVTYAITAGSLVSGLSLNTSSGLISGTPVAGSTTFTVTASDDGGNTNNREFELTVNAATGGSVTTSGGYTIHTFTSSDTFEVFGNLELEVLAVGAGGGGGADAGNCAGGGGAGGGMITTISGDSGASTAGTITAGTYSIVVGAGGAGGANASNQKGTDGGQSYVTGFGTATGGGGGGGNIAAGLGGGGGNGATSGGASRVDGAAGGDAVAYCTGGGGGGGGPSGIIGFDSSGSAGGNGGDGSTSGASGTATSYAGGGGGGTGSFGLPQSSGGAGGGGQGSIADTSTNMDGTDGLGGGGGGGAGGGGVGTGGTGGNGVVIVRYTA